MTSANTHARLAILRETLSNYQELMAVSSDAWPLLELVAVKFTRSPWSLDETAFDRVLEALAAEDQTGWARCRSALAWTGMARPPDFATAGEPIIAEWTHGSNASARLRVDQAADRSARLWHYTERVLGDGEQPMDGERAFLRESTTVLAHVRVTPYTHLAYHIFWGADPGSSPYALRRLFDRFAGFTRPEAS